MDLDNIHTNAQFYLMVLENKYEEKVSKRK